MNYLITEYKETDRKRIEFCLDETMHFWLYPTEAKKLSLEEGMELSEEQYQHILHGIIGKRAARRAMHLLGRQEKTECQLREKLVQNHYPKEAIEDAVAYVKNYHYLDDMRYAKAFICSHQKDRSRTRLKQDLMQRGISGDIIEQSLEEEFIQDEQAQIRSLLEKKHYLPDIADQKEYKKICQFLQRRGFLPSDISAVMAQYRRSDF